MLKPPASRLDSLQLPETHQTFSGFLSSEFLNGKIEFWTPFERFSPQVEFAPLPHQRHRQLQLCQHLEPQNIQNHIGLEVSKICVPYVPNLSQS